MKDALTRLGPEVAVVSLGIDGGESADLLRRYAEQNGFTWRFAVPPREMVREMGDVFGGQFLIPPAKPMFVVDRGGRAHRLPFGTKSADSLRGSLEQHR